METDDVKEKFSKFAYDAKTKAGKFTSEVNNEFSTNTGRKLTTLIILVLGLSAIGSLAWLGITGNLIGPSKAELGDKLGTCEDNLEQLFLKKEELNFQIASLNDEKADLEKEIEGHIDNLNECKNDLSDCGSQLSDTEESVKSCIDDLKDLDNQVSELQSSYEGLSENSANKICCLANTLGATFAGYEIEDDQVKCLNEGGSELNCD